MVFLLLFRLKSKFIVVFYLLISAAKTPATHLEIFIMCDNLINRSNAVLYSAITPTNKETQRQTSVSKPRK